MSVYKVCSDMLSIAVKSTMTKNRLGGKGLFGYRLWDITERSQSRKSRQGLGGRTMKESNLLVCSLAHVQLPVLFFPSSPAQT